MLYSFFPKLSNILLAFIFNSHTKQQRSYIINLMDVMNPSTWWTMKPKCMDLHLLILM